MIDERWLDGVAVEEEEEEKENRRGAGAYRCRRVCSQVKVLKCIEPARLEETVLGQYVGDPNGANDDVRHSYADDPTVKKGITCLSLSCLLSLFALRSC